MYSVDKNFLKDTFISLASLDSQSDPDNADNTPSTAVQHNFAKFLAKFMKDLGLSDVSVDEHAYVTGKLDANIDNKTPIAFISHIDTAPDAPASGVKPIVHEYKGGDIKLPKDGQIIKVSDFSELKDKEGHTIITSDGSTLLGGDDKAGITVALGMAKYLIEHPEIEHGDVFFFFTPDEEIGHGASLLDIDKFDVHHGYTLDGHGIGTLSVETFSADFMELEFFGKEIHPGEAKHRMINALRMSASFLNLLPAELRPETTEGHEGFVHPLKIEGDTGKVKISMIIRDFITENLEKYENIVKNIADGVVASYPGSSYQVSIKQQYRNMKYKLEEDRRIIDYAVEAHRNVGIEPVLGAARGGTDGSQLSYRGLLAPDISVGYYAMHSKQEWLSLDDLAKSAGIVIELVKIWGRS